MSSNLEFIIVVSVLYACLTLFSWGADWLDCLTCDAFLPDREVRGCLFISVIASLLRLFGVVGAVSLATSTPSLDLWYGAVIIEQIFSTLATWTSAGPARTFVLLVATAASACELALVSYTETLPTNEDEIWFFGVLLGLGSAWLIILSIASLCMRAEE